MGLRSCLTCLSQCAHGRVDGPTDNQTEILELNGPTTFSDLSSDLVRKLGEKFRLQ